MAVQRGLRGGAAGIAEREPGMPWRRYADCGATAGECMAAQRGLWGGSRACHGGATGIAGRQRGDCMVGLRGLRSGSRA